MRRRAKAAGLAVGILMAIGSRHSGRAADGPDLAEIRAAMANPSIPASERARRALEGSARLDQAAQQAGGAADRRLRWSEAVTLLDEFLSRNPEVESAPLIRFQAAVYRWAEGRSFVQQADLAPSDTRAREGAIGALDDAIRRLRAIGLRTEDSADPFAQNVHFRLAQAIADRARFLPEGDATRLASEREALGLLDASLTAPGLRPFARLLRSELSTRLGLFGQAQVEVEDAEKLTPPPPAAEILEAKIAALTGREDFSLARKVVEAARVDGSLKSLMKLRILLAQRRALGPGRERDAIDAAAFAVAEALRGSGRPESRKAMFELARGIDEPARDAPPEWWDLLAEGRLRLGDTVRAGRLDLKAADRADALGKADQAATLRYKAGACLFEAGRFVEADRWLSEVTAAPAANPDLRARSGMLRALARGRALASRQPGASTTSYLEALEAQVGGFPDNPASGEARWLLGQIRQTEGRRDEAIAIWNGIPHGHPRWLEARMLLGDLLREAVEDQRINRDAAATETRMDQARKSLRDSLESASAGAESVGLSLQLARLDLIPFAGHPTQALEACDRILKSAARPEDHLRARLYRMVALAQAGRAIEAEQVARVEMKSVSPADLIPAIRLLDRSASEAESDSGRRRLGLILRILTTRLVERLDLLDPRSRDEARLRHARSLLFSGDPAAAKREISAWGGPQEADDAEFLRDLADTYLRLEAYGLVVDAERLRSRLLPPGSLPWFEARYGLALALFHSSKSKEAGQVIDATAILHPDLGGGDLRVRFERLRQRIGQER